MVELIALPPDQMDLEVCLEWMSSFRNDLLGTDPKNILVETYVSLTLPEETDLSEIYDSHYEMVTDGVETKV